MTDQQRISRRIASLGELRNVVRAMRGMAAARVEAGQEALSGMRNRVKIVEDAIAAAASLLDAGEYHARKMQENAGLLIVIASEHGFVGSFNENILEHAKGSLKPGQRTGVVGRRGGLLIGEKNVDPAWKLPGPSSIIGTGDAARAVANASIEFDHIDILFARYQSGGRYAFESRPVLPLPQDLLEAGGNGMPPLHHLSPERLLLALAGEYLFAELSLAMAEGFVSENATRLAMMQVADHNISEKVQDLEQKERMIRQESITMELLEIVTGEEAAIANGRSGP